MRFLRLCSLFVVLAIIAPWQVPAQESASRAGRLARILSSGEIRVGLQKNFQPFHIDGARKDHPGLDVEIARTLGKALGVRVRFEFLPLQGLLTGVALGSIDVALGGMSSNLERARSVRFARPYMITSAGGLLDRRSLPAESESIDFPRRNFDGLSDLRYLGKLKIGVRTGTSNRLMLKLDPFFKKHDIVEAKTRESLLALLKNGSIDLLVADRPYLKALLMREPGLKSRFIFLHDTYREEHLSPAVPPGDAEFLLYIDFFIKELERSGDLDRLRGKYFEDDDWIP